MFFVPIQSISQQKWQQPKHHYSIWVTLEKPAGHSFSFNPDGIKERPRSYHKMLTSWKYLLRTKLPRTALGLMGSWTPGLLVKTLSMHWKTQMLCILTVPFLLTLLKGPPNNCWEFETSLQTMNSERATEYSQICHYFIPGFMPKLFNWNHESSSIPCW